MTGLFWDLRCCNFWRCLGQGLLESKTTCEEERAWAMHGCSKITSARIWEQACNCDSRACRSRRIGPRGSLISQYMSPAREARGMVADGLYWKDQLSQATLAVFAVSFVWLRACNTVPFWTRAWASSEDISKSKHEWPSVLSLQLGRLIQTFSIADFPKFVKCFRMPWWYCSCCSLLASRLLCLDPVSWPWVRTKLWRSLARGTDSTSLL